MNKRVLTFIFILFLLPGLVTGCNNKLSPDQNNNAPTSTLVPSPTHSLLPTMTETSKTIATFVPSLPPISKDELIATNGNCKLPCFWGIQPGETKWSDLLRLFEQIDARGATGLSPRKIETFTSAVDFEQFSIQLDAYRKDDVVGAMIVTIASRSPLEAIPPEMERYSLKNTFSDLGNPSRLLLQFSYPPEGPSGPVGYSLWMNHDEAGLQEVYLGDMQNQVSNPLTICPEVPFEQAVLYLFSPDLNFLPWSEIMLGEGDNVTTVGEISPEDFNQTANQDNALFCFKGFRK